MSKGDWLVLCALIAEKTQDFGAAIRLLQAALKDDITLIHHVSVEWWVVQNVEKLSVHAREHYGW